MVKRINIVNGIFDRWKVVGYEGNKRFKCERLKSNNRYLVRTCKLKDIAYKKHGINSSGTPIQVQCLSEIKRLLDINKIHYIDKESLDKMSYDFYIEDYKLVISFIYTLDYINNKKRNQNLTIACRDKGIHLINIFEYEWRDAVKRAKLINMIVRNTTKTNIQKIYARNTRIVELDNAYVRDFLDKNHLQGSVHAKIVLALTYNNDIVAVMTFGKPRFGDDDGYELLRLAFKSDTEVIGGSEKLFNYFIKNYNPCSIMSFCAITKFTGRVYHKLGFSESTIELTSPNYQWVHTESNVYLPRYQCMKQKLIDKGWGTKEETEDSIMRKHGFFKVFDSGNEKYTWYRSYTNKVESDKDLIDDFNF